MSNWRTAPVTDVRSEWVFRRYGERPAVDLNWPSTDAMREQLIRQDIAKPLCEEDFGPHHWDYPT